MSKFFIVEIEKKKKHWIKANRVFKATTFYLPFINYIFFCVLVENWQKIEKRKKIEEQNLSREFWKMICRKWICSLVRKNSFVAKKKKKRPQNFSTSIRFLSRILFVIIVAISQFAHHQQPIRCRAHGGIRNVVTRVYWSERINMDAKVIVKCALIHRCVI